MRSLDRARDEWLTALIREGRALSAVGYRDLATGLRAAIVSGEVPVGTKLPPQREFARLLSISRTSVVSAYNLCALNRSSCRGRAQARGLPAFEPRPRCP